MAPVHGRRPTRGSGSLSRVHRSPLPAVRRRCFCTGLASAFFAPRSANALEERVLESVRSPYNHIVVAERGTLRTMYFVVDGVHYIESRWDRRYPRSLDLDYTRTMMAGYLVNPRATKILMIGFGGGQISNYLFDRFDGLEVDAVDIDAEVVRLARQYFGVPKDPRYRTHVADGRLFVERTPAEPQWDMVILDAFRGVFVPFHLKTVEYYEALKARLRPGGVVVANLHSLTEMYKHDRNTFAEVFPHGYCFRSENGRQSTLVASVDPQPVGAYAMRAAARELRPRFDFDLEGLAARWMLENDWDRTASVLRDDFPPGKTPQGAERHNLSCVEHDCPYRTDR